MIELPSDHALDDWPQYVNMRDFNHMLPIQPPDRPCGCSGPNSTPPGRRWRALVLGLASLRLGPAGPCCQATVELIEYMQHRGGVWFATMAEIAAHIDGLVSRGEWSPRSERLPFWSEPVPQIARPIR
jgi:hypothetical protein